MGDALSELLRAVRLTGGVFLDADFSAPWCVSAHLGPAECRAFDVSPEHVIATHYVLEGQLRLALHGDDQGRNGARTSECLELHAGDLVLLARNDPHLLGSDLTRVPVPADDLIMPPTGDASRARIEHGGGGERTRIVCGYLACDVPMNPLFESLPRVFTLRSDVGPARDWIDSSFRFAAKELSAGRPGSDTVLAKLSELLFVEAVRSCLATLPPDRKGWLAGLSDPQIGRALALLHGKVAHPWTVDELAREVGVSRSVLAERFTSLLGEPPMRYLARWRMQLASQRLRESRESIAEIAARVGYDSEAAFHRAFKRELGVPPATYRRQGAA